MYVYGRKRIRVDEALADRLFVVWLCEMSEQQLQIKATKTSKKINKQGLYQKKKLMINVHLMFSGDDCGWLQ